MRNLGVTALAFPLLFGGCGERVAANKAIDAFDTGPVVADAARVDVAQSVAEDARVISESPATVSKYEACFYYEKSAYNRRASCEGNPESDDPAPEITDLCPDALFSDGADRSVAEVMDCAEQLETYPCDLTLIGVPPDCAKPGLRAPGQSCVFASQCPGECFLNGRTCGFCFKLAKRGETCGDGDPATGCENPLRCTNGVCVDDPTINLSEGMQCEQVSQCLPTLDCIGGICQVAGGVGASCTLRCAIGAYCTSGNICRALPQAGQGCGAAIYRDLVCQDGAFCDTSGATPICATKKGVGDVCTSSTDCAQPLICACSDSACTGRVCKTRAHMGEACGSATVMCVPGTVCQQGQCSPVDSQGIFAARCSS